MGTGWELNLDRETFLAQHWQRKPLLIRDSITNFSTPLSRDALSGLALEEMVESRIIEQRDSRWLRHHGPFNPADYARDVPWTLLVQAVDHYVEEVAELRRLIDFLPQWRVDDVMASFAVDGGSVGPHFDNYDVFLLQGEGVRLWKLGQFCDDSTPLVPHDELCILASFDCQEEYLLSPGDMLYIPPGVAHWGIAKGDCTTFSIGFRAPRLNDMVSRWADQLLQEMDAGQFYRDAGQSSVTRAGEIRAQDLQRAMSQLQGALDQGASSHWFGELVTEPRYEPGSDEDDLAEARALLAESASFVALSPAAKLAWQQDLEGIAVFANGESRLFEEAVLPTVLQLCESWRLEKQALQAASRQRASAALLDFLLETGCIYVE